MSILIKGNPLLDKEHMRRELLALRLARTCSREQLQELHRLDEELSGVDIAGVMFDELEKRNKVIESLEKELIELWRFTSVGARNEMEAYDVLPMARELYNNSRRNKNG